MKRQHSFPQRVGSLIEGFIIEKEQLYENKRQNKYGYYDAYKDGEIYEIKAAKDNNYFRIMQKNHKKLLHANGSYILVRYNIISMDECLRLLSDIVIINITTIKALDLKDKATSWNEDQRKKNMYYKVKL